MNPTNPSGTPAAVNSDLFTRLVSGLKFTGALQINNRAHLIINSVPYKEGDSVPVTEGTATYRLRVKTITNTHVTFALGDAEQTVTIR